MEIIKIIGVKDIDDMSAKIAYRQKNFAEDLTTAIGVVIMNYGDDQVRVKCVGQEWSGIKGELPPQPGVLLCPNGHPIFETSMTPRLVLVRLEE